MSEHSYIYRDYYHDVTGEYALLLRDIAAMLKSLPRQQPFTFSSKRVAI